MTSCHSFQDHFSREFSKRAPSLSPCPPYQLQLTLWIVSNQNPPLCCNATGYACCSLSIAVPMGGFNGLARKRTPNTFPKARHIITLNQLAMDTLLYKLIYTFQIGASISKQVVPKGFTASSTETIWPYTRLPTESIPAHLPGPEPKKLVGTPRTL